MKMTLLACYNRLTCYIWVQKTLKENKGQNTSLMHLTGECVHI